MQISDREFQNPLSQNQRPLNAQSEPTGLSHPPRQRRCSLRASVAFCVVFLNVSARPNFKKQKCVPPRSFKAMLWINSMITTSDDNTLSDIPGCRCKKYEKKNKSGIIGLVMSGATNKFMDDSWHQIMPYHTSKNPLCQTLSSSSVVPVGPRAVFPTPAPPNKPILPWPFTWTQHFESPSGSTGWLWGKAVTPLCQCKMPGWC